LDLSGVFIPVASPFTPAGELDLDAFRANVTAWLSHSIRGLVVAGSTGEAVLLDEAERLRLLEAAREALGERLLIAGTGAESRRTTLRLTEAAAGAGADAVLVQPPAFYKGAMTSKATGDHFRAVADASPLPVLIYQVPLKMSTLDLPNDLIVELSEHPNIVGIKDSRGKLELIRDLVERCEPGFQVIVGNGALLLPALEAGAAGGILGVANLMPGACTAVFRAWKAGRPEEARSVQGRVAPVHISVIGGMGVPGVKAALDRLGMQGGPPRPPLRPLGTPELDEVEAVLRAAGLDVR
jgi:4-hydroxy-2-oxoglutarate aldolase